MDSLNQLSHSEFLDIECVLSHILTRFQRHSRAVVGTDWRVSDGVAFSPDEIAALTKFHDILSAELYG